MLMGDFSPSGIGAPVLIEDLSKLDNQSCPSEGCHLACPSKEGSCNLPLPKLGSRDKTHYMTGTLGLCLSREETPANETSQELLC